MILALLRAAFSYDFLKAISIYASFTITMEFLKKATLLRVEVTESIAIRFLEAFKNIELLL